MAEDGFDAALQGFREALRSYMTGDPAAVTGFFSRREDVTLANPLGPPRRGPADVDRAIAEGASFLRDGSVRGFEEVVRFSTPELAYVVQLERTEARFPDSDDMVPIELRVTLIFRPENGAWKIAHRHADPITTARPISSVIQN